jgi:hypothetical protein
MIDSACCEHNLFDLERTIMTRIRPIRQRPMEFEALEGRLALSTGMAVAVASPHADAVIIRQTQHSIPTSFKGQTSITNGSTLMTTNLRGTIGKDRFVGSGTGTVVGKLFQGGDVYLSNSQGSIHLKLGPAIALNPGKKGSRQEVAMVVADTTGKYGPFTGSTGTLTTWNVPAKPNATASFSGFFNS